MGFRLLWRLNIAENASWLHQHCEDYAAQQGAVLFYTLVLENNTPAMRYLERRGFKLYRKVVMPGLVVYKKMAAASSANFRSARPEDLGALAELLNETWEDFDRI